jgi:nucleoside-diphosphate-sugar epimerase
MRLAITGGSGQLGRAVTELARSTGHSVVSIDRVRLTEDPALPDFSFIQADITHYADIGPALRGCDALVHLAAIPSPNGFPDHEVHNNNVVGSYNALSAAARLGIKRVCQASSVNAIGATYSRWPRYDYFPLDEDHPTYNEDPYGLSKWICEQQGNSFARRYGAMTIASLRLHWLVQDRATAAQGGNSRTEWLAKQLWGYTSIRGAARACLLSLSGHFQGHEVFHVIAPQTVVDEPSLDLKKRFFADVPVRGDLPGNRGFYDCRKAERLLGWTHDAR